MNKRGIIITGTDTGVGKTCFAACLAAALVRQGVDVGVMKPVETGCRRVSGKLIPEDALRLLKASGADDEIDLVCPYRFMAATSPEYAAKAEGRKILLDKIMNAFSKLRSRHEFLIIEGAGGLMVPLTRKLLMADLFKAMNLPVAIVAGVRLGTINHLLLTERALAAYRIPLKLLVINHAFKVDAAVGKSTVEGMRKYTSAPDIVEIPRRKSVALPHLAKIFDLA
jgi:dethiobiotin synthetase